MTATPSAPILDTRCDEHLGVVVHIVRARQHRPNLPTQGCPFCVGGLEAPEHYRTKAFPNRWPALGEGRCEVVLYSPEHDASLGSIGVDGVRRVIELWRDRTAALMALDGVEFVLVFENRGPEVGATIAHPHGQIYAFDHVPRRPQRRLETDWMPDLDAGDRSVSVDAGWHVWTNRAPVHPVSLTIAPERRVGGLVTASAEQLDGLAVVLQRTLAGLDRLYERPLPYMMWLNQAPRHPAPGSEPWFNIELVSPWRAAGVPRFIAAAEVACEEYFNPVDPADVAAGLRSALADPA